MKTGVPIQSTAALSINKKILLQVIYTQNLLHESFSDILKTYDLSPEQFNVLEILKNQKGKPANMCVIQEKMITKTSNTTRLVDKLLQKGLATREVCSENRRKIDVYITTKGLEIIKEVKPFVTNLEEQFVNNLSLNELKNLNFLLKKYRNT